MAMPSPIPLALAILAGGESRRMGTDKAHLPVDGVPLLERLVRAGIDAGLAPILVVGRSRPDGWNGPDVLFFPDDTPGEGPIGGLASALRVSDRPVLLLACDLPRMDAVALRWLAARWARRTPGTAGLVATRDGRIEPLFAVYGPELRDAVAVRRAQGRRSVTGLAEEAGVATVAVPPEIAPRLDGANTPGEWDALVGG